MTEKIERRLSSIAVLALLLIYFSPLAASRFFFAQFDGPIYLVPALIAAALLVCRASWLRFLLPLLAAACCLVAVQAFLKVSGGKLLFSDDHPSFLYRLIQLYHAFPNIPFYNPQWNGGVEAREFFPSGILSVFLLSLPFSLLGEVREWYNYLVLFLCAALVPLSLSAAAYFTVHSTGGRSLASSTAAVLAISCSLIWYRFALAYGTLGFIVSSAILPLNLALLNRLLAGGYKGKTWEAVLLAFTLILGLQWPPIVFAYLPAGIYLLARLRSLLGRPKVAAAVVIAALLVLPGALLFLKASPVAEFISGEGIAGVGSASMKKYGSDSWEYLEGLNSLILVFGIVGVIAALFRPSERLMALSSVWCLAVAALGPVFLPQLELDRYFLIAAMPSIVPAATYLTQLWLSNVSLLARALALSCLLYSPFWVGKVYSVRTVEKFNFAQPIVPELVNAISSNVKEGRVLFAGFILHELSYGHIAPLAEWSGVPIVASSYQHDRWHYTDIIPESYRQRKELGVMEYLDLMNISHIVTHEKFWRKWFGSRTGLFEQVWHSGPFTLLRRKEFKGTYFLLGSGEILSQGRDSLSVRLETESAVLKFRYFDFLQAYSSSGERCRTARHQASSEISLIALEGCKAGATIEIRAVSPLKRLLTTGS
ncbi:MAG: hypothetical protein DCC75_02420 [Proteobacteria bacterium]|nr:MAG: hypothetical protein DCC75_02420 [Pseudomonadota bacterium]